jgi:aspartate aminotransferase/aminotransferase
VFEQTLMNEMLNKNISYFIHAPRSAQTAYAQTMKKLQESDLKNLTSFYKKKVDYVLERLKKMGAAMPDPLYQVEATFYALGNFKDLFGLKQPAEIRRALQTTDCVSTDEELAYYLLFNDSLMVAPLSYFGLAKDSGYIRITCSGNEEELIEIMDRLEHRLFEARQVKKIMLLDEVTQKMPELKKVDSHMYDVVSQKIDVLNTQEDSCLTLKTKNHVLATLQSILRNYLGFLEEIS